MQSARGWREISMIDKECAVMTSVFAGYMIVNRWEQRALIVIGMYAFKHELTRSLKHHLDARLVIAVV